MQRFSPSRLRSARLAAGVRPEYAAVALGRSVETIRVWESGRVTPNADQLATLAALYDVQPGAFYEPVIERVAVGR